MHPNKTNLPTKPNPCKTRAQVASELGVSTRTLSRRMRKAKLAITPGLLTHKEQSLIYQLFGKSHGDIDKQGADQE